MDYIVEFQAGSKKIAVSRSWILLDHHGKSIIVALDKYEMIRRLQIHARDLRILDPMLSYPSTILVREKVIVLNLEHIKAIITAEEVLIRDPFDNNVIPVVEELQRRLPLLVSISKRSRGEEEGPPGSNNYTNTSEKDEFPFELRALDVVLEAICSYLDARTRELETAAYPALDELTSKISSRNLDRVRKLKSIMTRLTNRVQKVRDELEQLLDDDEHMANLFLSKKMVASPSSLICSSSPNGLVASPCIGSKTSKTSRASPAVGQEENIGELEMILETYFTQIDATVNKLTMLREYTDNTEDYINIQLDNQRNQLIQLELLLGSAAVSLALYSLVTAIFGMNIPYTWKEGHAYVFKWVIIVTGIVGASIFLSIIAYARHKGLIGSWHLTLNTRQTPIVVE